MTQTATQTSEPQRMRALQRANEVRLARAAIKRHVALGKVSAADVLLECPDAAASWPVGELLMSQRRWGTTRCRRFLTRNHITETKPIGSLTERQRQMLAGSLRETATAPEMELIA